MDAMNYYFDDTHPLSPFTHAAEANPGSVPPKNALRDTAPEMLSGYWPCAGKDAWIQIEDHRGEKGWVDGKPCTVADIGPLPAGWSDTPPPPTVEEQQAAFTTAIQLHLDSFAQTRNYDGIMSAATYATSSVQKFKAEGQYAVDARDSTWNKAYKILDDVLSGARPMPTIEEVIAELPSLAWPEVAS